MPSYLFGAEPLVDHGTNPQHRHSFARINNDVPEFVKLIRDDRPCDEKCHFAKANADVLFYQTLRNRFRNADAVNAFRETYFTGRNVIGIHIRAGNGESGDFSERNRNIADLSSWLQSLAGLLRMHLLSDDTRTPIIFLATDTERLVSHLQSVLPDVEIVSWAQQRPTEGSGVSFGEQGKVNVVGESCLDNWEDTFTDMMLLSYANILVAARPSSFTQGLPMSLTLAADGRRFCEVNFDATAMQCYDTFEHWCCNGTSSFSLEGIKQRYEYIRMPKASSVVDLDSDEDRRRFKISERPGGGVCAPLPMGRKQPCLPFDWSQHIVVPREAAFKDISSKSRMQTRSSRTHVITKRRPK